MARPSYNRANKYFSTTIIAKSHDISPKPYVFDMLLEQKLIYKDGKHYKLTESGVQIGGKYRRNENNIQWIVWKEHSLDDLINELKLKLSNGMMDNQFCKIEKEPSINDLMSNVISILDKGVINNDDLSVIQKENHIDALFNKLKSKIYDLPKILPLSKRILYRRNIDNEKNEMSRFA